MARTFAHKTVTDLAEYASIPVINGLTDLSHPCQVMADYFTAWEKFGGELKGRKLAWIGDGNNMAHSLMFGAPKVGMDITVATPPDYAPDPAVVAQAAADAQAAGTKLIVTNSIDEACARCRHHRDRCLDVDGAGGGVGKGACAISTDGSSMPRRWPRRKSRPFSCTVFRRIAAKRFRPR